MSRIPALDPGQMTPEQRRVHDTIAAGPRGRVGGPLAIWLHRPELADRAQALGRYCRYDSSLPPRLSELAILVTAVCWRSEFEWHAHAPIAASAGVPEPLIEAIRTGAEPVFERDDDALVYRFARTLHDQRRIPDELYRGAVETLGEDAVVDLVGILGYYTLVSMTINAFEIELPDGAAAPW